MVIEKIKSVFQSLGLVAMSQIQIRTVCPRDCYDSCHLVGELKKAENRVILKGDKKHPITQGFTCPRGAKDLDRAFSPERILFPYIRNKLNSEKCGEKCSWDDALALMTIELKRTLAQSGPKSVLHIEYAGNTGLLTWYFPQRIWNTLGATKTDYSICSKSGREALSLHYGSSHGIQLEELLKQKLIVFWGFNAAVSSPHIWRLARQAKERNHAKIVVVDPRINETAKHADIHLRPTPGTDVALAYGVARILIDQEFVHTSFLNDWTSGFDQFREEVESWSISQVEARTGIQDVKIEEFALAYGSLRPSVILIGLGMQKSLCGAEAVRAIGLLPPLIGLHRGFFYSNGNAYPINFNYLTGTSLTSTSHRVVSQIRLGRLIEKGEFNFIFIHNMNPALTLPNQSAVRKGLMRKDVFVVTHETHWSETTKYSDLVLPAPTYLEKEDLVIPWGHHYIQKSHPIIKPQGESRTEVWLMQQIAQRLGRKEQWLFEQPWHAIKIAIADSLAEGTFDDLQKGKTMRLQSKPINEYMTPSGKIEFFSSAAQSRGLNPLPVQLELQLAPEEFTLLNSALENYTHTQFQDIYGKIPAIVHIHPQDAKPLGIQEGAQIQLVNALGRIQVKAVITDAVPSRVLWSPRQFMGTRGEPQNCLTPDTPQIIGKGSVFNSTRVRIAKVITQ